MRFPTVLLSGQVEARKPSRRVKRVGRISRRVLGVLDTTIFQTWREACRTTSCVSERPIYRPERTRLRRSAPRAPMIAWRKRTQVSSLAAVITKDSNLTEMHSYFIGSGCSKVVILGSCLCGHLSCHSRDVEQQIAQQLHRAEPANSRDTDVQLLSKGVIRLITNALLCASI